MDPQGHADCEGLAATIVEGEGWLLDVVHVDEDPLVEVLAVCNQPLDLRKLVPAAQINASRLSCSGSKAVVALYLDVDEVGLHSVGYVVPIDPSDTWLLHGSGLVDY